MIDGFIWNKNPIGYHISNVLLHLQVTFIIYILLISLFGDKKIAMAAATLFAVHPVHSEAVAYISARTHILCAYFSLLSFYFYDIGRKKGKGYLFILSFLLMIAAALSNEMAVSMPALFLAYELSFHSKNGRNYKYVFISLVSMFLFVVIRFFILGISIWTDVSLSERFFTGIGVIERYMKLLVLPVGLKVFYMLPLSRNYLDFNVLVGTALLLFHMFLGFYFWGKSKKLFFGLIWIFITLLPVSNIPAVLYPSLLAERYLYLPSVGFAIIFGTAFSYFLEFMRGKLQKEHYSVFRKVLFVTGGLLTALFIIFTYHRNSPYENEEKLWMEAVKSEPKSVYVHYKLALAFEEAGKFEKAKDELEIVFKTSPQRVIKEKLISLYKKLGLNDAEAYYRIGVAYLDKGLYNSSMAFFLRALKYDNKFSQAHNALGVVMEEKGRYSEAASEFKKAVELNPKQMGYRENLKRALTLLHN